jgi:hypothetical protein
LLLPIELDQTVTRHKEYQKACEAGYECYFEEMYQTNEQEDDFIFVEHLHTRSEVLNIIVQDIKNCPRWTTCLAWRAGFIHGWLSALALTNFPLAQLGLHLLQHLSRLEQLSSSSQNPGRTCKEQQQIDAILRFISERGEG